jgi:hypothetical protein
MWMKWKLMVTCLPFVAAALLAKEALVTFAGFEGLILLGDMGFVLTGGIFLVGFMLAGTLADYKESERIPGDLASGLEALEETLVLAASSRPTLDPGEYRRRILGLGHAIHDWLLRRLPLPGLFATLERMNDPVQTLDAAGTAPPILVKAHLELQTLRRIVTRASVISRTGFLVTGYALLELLIVMLVGLLMITRFDSHLSLVIFTTFVTLIYVYMYRLIKDIDDPFEYSSDGHPGATEVPLFPITEYLERLEARTEKGPEPVG